MVKGLGLRFRKNKKYFSASCFYLDGGVFSGAVCKIRELFERNRPYKKKGWLIYMRGVAGVAGYGVEAMPVYAGGNQKG